MLLRCHFRAGSSNGAPTCSIRRRRVCSNTGLSLLHHAGTWGGAAVVSAAVLMQRSTCKGVWCLQHISA